MSEEIITNLRINKLRSSPFNPRTDFGNLDELADTMNSHMGIIEPIIVRPMPGREGEYEIVIGERRMRAAKKAKRDTIPAKIRKMSDDEVMRMQIIENLQRKDLTPVEEGKLFKELNKKFKQTIEFIAKQIGKSHEYVEERIGLLELPDEVQKNIIIAQGETEPKQITVTKAIALVPLKEDEQKILAKKIQKEGMTSQELKSTIKKAKSIETTIALVKREPLRRALERKFEPLRFEKTVTLADVEEEISKGLGKPVGPSPEKQWDQIVNHAWALHRPYMKNSFVREWKSGDRNYIQVTLWMDLGAKITELEREDHKISEFRNFEDADKYAEEKGGYCSGIIGLRGEEYWVIYVRKK